MAAQELSIRKVNPSARGLEQSPMDGLCYLGLEAPHDLVAVAFFGVSVQLGGGFEAAQYLSFWQCLI